MAERVVILFAQASVCRLSIKQEVLCIFQKIPDAGDKSSEKNKPDPAGGIHSGDGPDHEIPKLPSEKKPRKDGKAELMFNH